MKWILWYRHGREAGLAEVGSDHSQEVPMGGEKPSLEKEGCEDRDREAGWDSPRTRRASVV